MERHTHYRDDLAAADNLPSSWEETIPPTWRSHRPDWHGRLAENGKVRAACSLWWREAPPLEGETLAVIGHFAASEMAAGRQILRLAMNEAGRQGASFVVGPMDGNTWRRYRWMDPETAPARPPFFLEPTNPAMYPEIWTQENFTPWARYQSALASGLKADDARLARAVGLPPGIRVRPLDPARFEADLRAMHSVSVVAFRDNLLYTPLAWPDFAAMYEPLREVLHPEFVLLAFDADSRPVGLAFGIPDLAEARQTGSTGTLIFKTVAVLPEWRGQKLGKWLFAEMHRRAAGAGLRKVIHALSAQTNDVVHLTAKYAEVFRTYTLYGRPVRAV